MGFQPVIKRPPSKIEFTSQQEDEIRTLAIQLAAELTEGVNGKEKAKCDLPGRRQIDTNLIDDGDNMDLDNQS